MKMSIKEIHEVCRLCLTSESLVCIFDEKCESAENMKDLIFITTGVKVREYVQIYMLLSITCLIENISYKDCLLKR